MSLQALNTKAEMEQLRARPTVAVSRALHRQNSYLVITGQVT